MYWHDDGDMAPVSLHSDITCVSRGEEREGRGERGEGRGERGEGRGERREGKVK